MARKLDMVDENANVMRTFNDYSEGTQMQFGSIDIVPESSWDGKRVMDIGLPKNVLLALVLRKGERLIPRGDTILQAGDKVIVVTKTFEDTKTYLVEKTVKKGGKRDGHTIGELSGESLVLLIRRNGEDIIPSGETRTLAGDVLVILNAK